MIKSKKIIIPPINVIATFIDIPKLENWKGNCYRIALKIVNEKIINDECRAIYGHYIGYISSKSYFKKRINMPFIRHGWIELSNEDIVDPTRWVFEAIEPYIAIIDKDDDVAIEYDEGGNVWRQGVEKLSPQFNNKEKFFPVVLKNEDCKEYLLDLLKDERGDPIEEVSFNQMLWVANLSLFTLGIYAKDIFIWLRNMGLNSLIPIDNQIKIFGIENK